LFYSRHPLLYDADSYYHLTVARACWRQGLLHDLPWARFSLMHPGFGDKEFLFHVLLAPFAALPDPLAGGRLALALLDALVLTAVGWLASRALGRWGLLVPCGLVLGSAELAWRLVRLRPELLSLFLFLLALWAVVRGRYRWLGALAAVYTLSYTAFHAFLGLCVLLFLFLGWARRRWEPGLVLYPALGAGIGLVVHPQFPKNLEVWVAQSVQFLVRHGTLDVGTETRPNLTTAVLFLNLAWILGIALLWRAGRPAVPATESETRAADVFGVAAVVFGGLYLVMSRFSVYAFPFATLWALFELRRRGKVPGAWVDLGGGRRVPAAAALAQFVLAGLYREIPELRTFAARTNPGPGEIRLRDREAVARALPPGARVAAPWRTTPIYMFMAPWASFLNVLDPIFMAAPYPRQYQLQSDLFDGSEPDPALAAAGLDSEFIACPLDADTRLLVARLSADPRVQTLYRGFNGVFRVGPGAGFVLDWKVVPPASPLPPPADAAVASWPGYPRLADPRGRELEGYVDARRVSQGRECVGLVHEEAAGAPVRIEYELAPSGPSTLWLDGRLLASEMGEPGAVLGRGIVLPVELTAGTHRLAVLTCPDTTPAARAGFYLVERKR
ncbi:MAG TPA: hypothetical protein VII86_02555, partial [Thermoanaerobaculia bacterium]